MKILIRLRTGTLLSNGIDASDNKGAQISLVQRQRRPPTWIKVRNCQVVAFSGEP